MNPSIIPSSCFPDSNKSSISTSNDPEQEKENIRKTAVIVASSAEAKNTSSSGSVAPGFSNVSALEGLRKRIMSVSSNNSSSSTSSILTTATSSNSNSSNSNSGNGRMSGVVVRAGETLEALFCLPPNVDIEHRQLCWDIAYGSKADNGMAWLQALQYANRAVQQHTSHLSSSSSTMSWDLVRLHQRAVVKLHITVHSSSPHNTTTVSEQCRFQILLSFAQAYALRGQYQEAHQKYQDLLLFHIGHDQAILYTTMASFYLDKQSNITNATCKDHQPNKEKAIQVLKLGLQNQAQPIHSIQLFLNQLILSDTKLQQHQNYLTNTLTFSATSNSTLDTPSSNNTNTTTTGTLTLTRRIPPLLKSSSATPSSSSTSNTLNVHQSTFSNTPNTNASTPQTQQPRQQPKIFKTVMFAESTKLPPPTSTVPFLSTSQPTPPPTLSLLSNTARKRNIGGALRVTYRSKSNSDTSSNGSSSDEENNYYDNNHHGKKENFYANKSYTTSNSDSQNSSSSSSSGKEEIETQNKEKSDAYQKDEKHKKLRLLSSKSAITSTTRPTQKPKLTKSELSYMLNWDPETYRKERNLDAALPSTNTANGMESSSLSSSVSSKLQKQQMNSASESKKIIAANSYEDSSIATTHPKPQEDKSSSNNMTNNTSLTATQRQIAEKNVLQEDINSMINILTKKRDHLTSASLAKPFSSTVEDEAAPMSSAISTTASSKHYGNLHKFHPDFINLSREENIIYVNQKPYAKLGVIGKGGSCKVYRALSSKDCQVVAIKRVKLEGKDKGSILEARTIDMYKNEIALLRKLSGNPSIIQMFDSEVDYQRKAIFLVMEIGEVDLNYVLQQQAKLHDRKKGSSNYHSENQYSFNMNFVRLTWQQMLSAVYSIHTEHGIVHGDLKPANFLFVKGALKLIDFGIAKAIPTDENTTNIYRDSQVGTLNYMSPEAIIGTTTSSGGGGMKMKLGRASDIWSLGCILYQMVYGKTPFADLHMLQKMHAIIDPAHNISYPDGADEAAVDAMHLCLQRKPEERPPIVGKNGLLNEHWFLHSSRSRRQQMKVGIPVDSGQMSP